MAPKKAFGGKKAAPFKKGGSRKPGSKRDARENIRKQQRPKGRSGK